MNIDVDALIFPITENKKYSTPTILQMNFLWFIFHLYWNAFKPGSMMDQRVQNQGKNADGRLVENGVSRLSTIPK